jgi:phosphoglycerate dehydrogenase-like enzyme
MTKNRILCTGPIDDRATEILSPFGEIVIAPSTDEEMLLSLVKGTVGLVMRAEGRADARLIEAARDLRVIGRSGAGFDNVDIEAATKRGIPVVYTPGANARAVAEAALTMMLALSKKLFFWDQQLKRGNWRSRDKTRSGDMDGSTLGIIGFGRIGQQLAELVGPLNMTVLAYDPYVPREICQKLNAQPVELNPLLKQSDIISLNAALTNETRSMINRTSLQKVKPGAFLINTARGGLIESLDVLLEALTDGRLAGVALDAYDPEPPDDSHPVFRHPRCIATPHALTMTPRSMGRIFESMAIDMAAVLKGRRPRQVVNPDVFE